LQEERNASGPVAAGVGQTFLSANSRLESLPHKPALGSSTAGPHPASKAAPWKLSLSLRERVYRLAPFAEWRRGFLGYSSFSDSVSGSSAVAAGGSGASTGFGSLTCFTVTRASRESRSFSKLSAEIT
jgi:hypothetical protein